MAAPTLDPNAPEYTRRYVNLADPRLGAQALEASDEFFAPKERMLNAEPAVFIVGKYDNNGKRVSGSDWCVVKLARPGVIKGIDIDPSHFTGNFPPAASIEGAHVVNGAPTQSTQWTEVVPSMTLQGNTHHYVDIASEQPFTHLRVNIYPDGGIARLRVYGQPQLDWSIASRTELFDLAA